VFVSHEGVLELRKRFDASQGDLRAVLGCLKYVLEKGGQPADDPFLLRDNEYSHPRTTSDDDDQRIGMPPCSLALTRR
jgi:hypothetical protein